MAPSNNMQNNNSKHNFQKNMSYDPSQKTGGVNSRPLTAQVTSKGKSMPAS